jgi:RNA polymerase sigma-70 factor (ECF subfamily)
MPDDLQAVFVLCEIEELAAPEAAELLAIPVGTVASRLRRAREHFQAAAQRMKRSTTRQP